MPGASFAKMLLDAERNLHEQNSLDASLSTEESTH